ncbi:probable aspartic-type endopeptidase AFUA_3G01220 [Aspergillus udagawae]|uniref:Probable aspartic-type endopeptidase AFUA_3G01220 n=1 Tax=Aspergillus udagawae TaxID=91492 RepID=A0A8H3P5G1_9EURO|nr:probable aspartic-type endopeptidase AFUA_3G01220 [Aspergillus udagawae]GFF43735.1 probable aspartic-type endopeptidase AFUA_3G01220 [Aspergillus udagawae]GFF79090.1 probable aspartic-type endopeptidase AFUA_3G01220 [Aspergillus udagawae]GFG26102.1 probable aspartic-type endopeptidase AFUA_3G01220 [Aspergillus udagawae]
MVGSCVAALLLGLAVSSAARVPELNSGKFHQSLKRRPLGLDLVTDNVVPLKPVHSVLRHQKGLHRRQSTSNGGITAINNPSQANYVAEVGWGNETYSMILDTGSSDTWILKEGFQCLDSTGAPTIQSNCQVGRQFSGDFTGGQIGNVNFNISYSTGILAGKFGWEDITIANITVKDAQVAVVDQAYFNFNVSGLFGLAFASLTSEFPGNDPTKNIKTHYMTYEPVFYKMVDQHLSLPTFSFAPDRDGPNGYFAVGGIPPVNTTGKTASASILTSKETRSKPSINRPDYYYINIDGAIVGRSNSTLSNSTSFPPFVGFVDTATTLTMLPTALATAIAGAFKPPATYVAATNLYEVPCNATAPKLAITISGVNFPVSPADLILQPQVDGSTGLCVVGFQDGGGEYVLGATFLNNVLSTFDLGALEVRFTALTQKL